MLLKNFIMLTNIFELEKFIYSYQFVTYMYQKKTKKRVSHSTTLKTIRMVEDVLKNLEYYTITFASLKRKLPKKVNHNTLKEVIRYLDSSNKIIIDVDGITWIHNPSKKLKKAIAEGYEFTPERISELKKFIKKYDKSG